MDENDAMRLLRALLEEKGAEWTEQGGYLRFRSRSGAMLWETACRAGDGALLIYGRFPFRAADPERARRICGELNRHLVRGALYLAEDGSPVYRCRAELDDVYGAKERIAAALQYEAQVIAYAWGRLNQEPIKFK